MTTTIVPPTVTTSEAGASSSVPVLGPTSAPTEQGTSLKMDNMMKEIEALELQMTELRETKEKLATIEGKYDKSKQDVAEKTREVKALERKIKELEKELTFDRTLTDIKKILWAQIGQSVTDQWQSIETIHEKMDLINLAQFENQKARASLRNMPEQANRMIHFFNTRTKGQLAALGISDRTETILLIKKVLTLRNFMQALDRKCQEMQTEVDEFQTKIMALHSRGLPSLLTSVGILLSHDLYANGVNNFASNQITASSSTSEDTGPPSGQSVFDKLENLFYITHEINHLFEFQPTFHRCTEAEETLIKIQRHQLPTEDWWNGMIGTLLRGFCLLILF